jgi:AraC-like DNA-binding protein
VFNAFSGKVLEKRAKTDIFLWRGCVLFTGHLPDLPLHAHVTEALCAGIDNTIAMHGDGLSGWTELRTALLPSQSMHEIQMRGASRFASLLFEPGSRLSQTVWGTAGEATRGILCDPQIGTDFLELLQIIDSSDSAQRQENAVERFLLNLLPSERSIDPRITDVVRRILHEPEDATPVEQLAESVGMSKSWLLHAFSHELNMPLRRFRNYTRLKLTALLLKSGESLASAAVGAGFYDQAHFNNTFRELFGLQPGLIFQMPGGIHWHVDEIPSFNLLSR